MPLFLFFDKLKCTAAILSTTMSNHFERISSTARFLDSTLTFDFWEASLPLRTRSLRSRIFYYDKTVFFIINTIVLMFNEKKTKTSKALTSQLCSCFRACGQNRKENDQYAY